MIRLENVSVQNGDFRLEDICLDVAFGNYAVLIGPTGCGKSTLLETICGLRPIGSGEIVLDDLTISSLPPSQRQIGFVPQDAALFPNMTVEQQIGFSLEVRKVAVEDYQRRVGELVDLLELNDLKHRMPTNLSGGQRQRVAIGRALAFKPKLLCLDEPLAAIDAEMRQRMVARLKSIHEVEPTTILHVTHYPEELTSLESVRLQFVDGKVNRA